MTKKQALDLIAKVIPQVKAITGKEPEFSTDEDCLMITMYRNETTIAPTNETVNETINAPINDPVKLTDTQQKIIDNIMDNPSISYDILADILHISKTTVKRSIQILKKAGIISRIGSDKTGYWQINETKRG